LGQGATFHFTIQAPVVAKPTLVYGDSFAPLPGGRRALIVDDSEICCQIVTHQLEIWGIQARAATCGEDALRWVQEGEGFDFAILDLYMPGMDGFTLAKKLRQHPHGAKLPLIMLTSHGDKSIYGEAEKLNFTALLAKPLKQAQLSRILRNILLQGNSATQPAAQFSSFDHTLAERMPLRILLAEDNLVNQKVAQYTLARLGYQVHVANNGIEVLQELQRQRYDVILMDVQMPEMDGLETTRRILAQWPQEQRPFIIAMTAHALTGDEAKCIDAGMNAYVTKPIQVERLVAALRQSQEALSVVGTS
jgi:CheY-like chemotaxis protein